MNVMGKQDMFKYACTTFRTEYSDWKERGKRATNIQTVS